MKKMLKKKKTTISKQSKKTKNKSIVRIDEVDTSTLIKLCEQNNKSIERTFIKNKNDKRLLLLIKELSTPLTDVYNTKQLLPLFTKFKKRNQKSEVLVNETNNTTPEFPEERTVTRLKLKRQKNRFSHMCESFKRTNQDTCKTHRPAVSTGDWVQSGDMIADCASSVSGELSIGQNILVAYLPWEGYNFEDAIVISERLVTDDLYTSVHIERYEITLKTGTKLGTPKKEELQYNEPDVITREIPGILKAETEKLDPLGIVKPGSCIKEGDILVGKLSIKELNQQESNQNESDQQESNQQESNQQESNQNESNQQESNQNESNPIVEDTQKSAVKKTLNMLHQLQNKKKYNENNNEKDNDEESTRNATKSDTKRVLEDKAEQYIYTDTSLRAPKNANAKVMSIEMTYEYEVSTYAVPKDTWKGKEKKKGLDRRSRSSVRPLFMGERALTKIFVNLAETRKIQVGDKLSGRHGNKGIVSLILPIQDMPYLPDGTSIDMVLNPLGVPSRMNVGQVYECLLGLAGRYLGETYQVGCFDEMYGPDASRSLVYNKLHQASTVTGKSWLFDPNTPGKVRLFDGSTGESFDQAVTVGFTYMLKLVHMVDDKIHARSTGPYSLITQQPLRGRSNVGGQRLGEMEVWALEGYGAAFTLLEMLTIKSDDMAGRLTLWSNIIRNAPIKIHTPESFKVLIVELQALCIDIGLF
uniref:DNA-directed RNA polymerase n=1 Tax=Polytoma uvella TaxID=40532 RepID=A0A1L2M5G4_9CHLO|nr:beta subunit of RNA polymerase 2 [Polytoma uvella]